MEISATIARSYKNVLYGMYGTIYSSWIWFRRTINPGENYILANSTKSIYRVHPLNTGQDNLRKPLLSPRHTDLEFLIDSRATLNVNNNNTLIEFHKLQ